jgi:polar amino acid transport system substrate-binding protein
MTRWLANGVRTLSVLGLGVALMLASGCGSTTPEASAGGPRSELNPALRDLLPASVRESGVLRVATDASYAPMSSFGPDGRTIIGMEPDLGDEIGSILGVKVKFMQRDFVGILDDVAQGKVDIAMSAITDTPERAEQVDFINYFSAGTAILVQRGNPEGVMDIADLCGRVVAVEEGTTQVDLLDRAQSNCRSPMDVRTYPTNSDALLQLRTGRAAAVLNDLPPAAYLVTNPETKAHYQLASDTQYEPGLYGVAVPKGEPGLRDALQGAFEQLVRSGVYGDVLAKWGVETGAVERISINSDR